MSVGIIGLGTYLPPEVRTNAWWPQRVVDDWQERMALRVTRPEPPSESLTPAMRKTLEVLREYADDPFRGARERRVMAADMTVPDMEASAAREAMADAEILPEQVDVILTQTPVPDQLMVNSACITHRLLGLPQRCITMGTEAACNSIALHMSLAKALIESGQARYVLSVHSSAITRVHGPAEPHSAWWGDGAAAVVIGRVREDRGLLSAVHYADGTACDAIVLGVPGRRYWEMGEITTYALDRSHTRSMFHMLVERAGDAITQALREAGIDRDAVDYYAAHQSTAWFATATATYAGLDRAKVVNTFPTLGHMTSANVPYILALGVREGALRDGSIVATFSGGAGETWSAMVMRWGR